MTSEPHDTETTSPLVGAPLEGSEGSEPVDAVDETRPMPPAATPEQPPRGLKVGYLVAGLVCFGIVAIWALGIGGVVDTSSFKWLAPAVLILAGAAGLAAAVFGQRRR